MQINSLTVSGQNVVQISVGGHMESSYSDTRCCFGCRHFVLLLFELYRGQVFSSRRNYLLQIPIVTKKDESRIPKEERGA
jgi:hypothetical protein